MKKDEIRITDIERILFGQEPPLFLLEVLVRTVLIYLILLVVVRWLGKRMSGQLSIMEMAVMLTLGAIVSVAMQVPDRGILLSAAVLLCALLFQRGLGWLGFENKKIESLIHGELDTLVKNGVLQLDVMKRCRISRQQLFAQLRSKKVTNLGMVKRVYLEASGLFSIFLNEKVKPGLSVLPPDDQSVKAGPVVIGIAACVNCGNTVEEADKIENCKTAAGMSGFLLLTSAEMSKDLDITDLRRVFIGEVPYSFFLELVIRAFVIYLILMVSMRLMGKRMSSQLGRNELAALVSLAAAIGVPLMAPDRGMLPAVVIAAVLVTIQRLIAKRASTNQGFEQFTQGNVSTLIQNGVIDVAVLESVGLSQERMFAELRCNAIKQLGEVERLYMEANGTFTLIESQSPVHGLATLPLTDSEFLAELELSEDYKVCGYCGKHETQPAAEMQCPNCNKTMWTTPVK